VLSKRYKNSNGTQWVAEASNAQLGHSTANLNLKIRRTAW